MSNDQSDDHMDHLLISAARDYNAPREVPREEMWSRIRAARSSSRRASAPRRVWMWPSMGVAAALLLTAGVLIGRRWERTAALPPTVAAAPTTDTALSPASPAVAAAASATATTDSASEIIHQLRNETTATNRRARQLASAEPRAGGSATESVTADQSASLSYQLVVLRHLAGSEAMITAFRNSAKRGELDAQLADWSTELLSTTRMLESSAADPTMRRLLEDLDLVLAQIKQYVTRGTNNPDELDLIEQSIIKRGVMTKLRSTIPDRPGPIGI